MLLIMLQTITAIFIFFIANTMTNARFWPSVMSPLYALLPTMFVRMIVLALPIYGIGILLLASAFNKDATLTSPTLLFANVLATIATSMTLDHIPFTWKIGLAASLCICAEIFLYLALRGKI